MQNSTAKGTLDQVNKTFFLVEPIDMFHKLVWEYTQLKVVANRPRHEQAYMSLNAAITAWHMCEWLAARLEPHHYQKLQDATGNRSLNSCRALQEFAKKDTSIAVCEQIANSAKHRAITRRGVPATTSERMLENDVGAVFWIPMVEDGSSSYPFYMAIDFAIRFWRRLFVQSGMATEAELATPPTECP